MGLLNPEIQTSIGHLTRYCGSRQESEIKTRDLYSKLRQKERIWEVREIRKAETTREDVEL